jgi:uncharacterized delta-60 repeat protein
MKKVILSFSFIFLSSFIFAQNFVLDSTFNLTGRKSFNFYNNIDRSYDCVVQPDNKIVLVGLSKNPSTNFFELCFTRVNTDGTIDNTFGTSGTTKVSMGNQSSIGGMTPRIKMDSDSRFVAVNSGRSQSGGSQDIMVCRLDSSGIIDPTFNTTGSLFVDMTGANSQPDQANGFDIDANGNIYIAGVVGIAPPIDNRLAIIKVTNAGLLDPTFDTDGKLTLNPGSGNEFGRSVVVQPDGKILVGSTAGNNSYLARIDSTGAFDTSFNVTGAQTISIGASTDLMEIALDSLNNIVVAATSGSTSIGVARLLPNGTFDPSFGTAGKTFFKLNNLDCIVNDMTIVSGNKILVSGSIGNSAQSTNVFVARLKNNGGLDSTFNSNGYYTNGYTSSTVEDEGYSIGLLNDGRIFSCGTIVNSSAVNEDIGMLMIKPQNTTTGISSLEINQQIRLYPNPANSDLTILSSQLLDVLVVDVVGKTFLKAKLQVGKNNINVQSLKPGLYFIRDLEGNINLKFVKD